LPVVDRDRLQHDSAAPRQQLPALAQERVEVRVGDASIISTDTSLS
jgi:hypothetical protein